MSFRRFYLPLLFLCIIISSCRLAPVIKEVEKTVYVETEKPIYVDAESGKSYNWMVDLSHLLIRQTAEKKDIWIDGKKTESYLCKVDLTDSFTRLPKTGEIVKIFWKGYSDKSISKIQFRLVDNNTETANWGQVLSDKFAANDIAANEDFNIEYAFTFTKDPIEKVIMQIVYASELQDSPATFTLSGLLSSKNYSFTLSPSGEPVVNPHKGFVQYAWSSDYINNIYWDATLASGKNEAWDYCSVVYTGAGWSSIHKGKNEYDWSTIDHLLTLCAENGRTLGWRIYPVNSSAKEEDKTGSGEHVPQYIYDEGCPFVDATIKGTDKTIRVPDWSNPIYIQACKDFAAEMARRYDGDKRVEFIDIRSFGNWGEWHCSQLIGSEMPSDEIQKDMIAYYASVFRTTQLVVPSDCKGDVLEYAYSLGVAKRNDGLIQIKDRELDLAKCYEAGLPAIGENCDVYKNLLKLDDKDRYHLKWTLERWKQVINISHMSYYELDRDTCARDFFKENADSIKEMNNKLGYNFEVTSANLKVDENNNCELTVKIKNTGLAPAFFDMNLIADACDALGKRKFQLGSSKYIKKGSFADGDEKTFVFYADFQSLCKGDFICLGLYEDAASSEPNIKFDNINTLKNNKLRLGEL